MWVNLTIFATGSGARGVLPGGRVLSRRSPSTPSSIEAVLPAPDTVLRLAGLSHDGHPASPSSLRRPMRARQTCFCGLFGSGTTVSRRRRSPEVSVNETPGRILQTSVIDKSEEHNNGYMSFLQNCRPDRFFALSRLILLSRAWVSGPPRGLLCFYNNKIPRRCPR